jgi:plastocyanin
MQMTRRSRLAAPAVVVMAAGLAVIAGVSVPGAGAAAGGAGVRTDSGTMQMQMPAAQAATAANARPAVELHRSIVHVTIFNFAFKPKRLVVSPGTRVVWTNKDSEPHTVTSDRPAFQSEAINTGGQYMLVARRIGTFTYHCQIHPFMHGALVVKG